MKIALVSAISDYPEFRAPGAQVDAPLGILMLATVIKNEHDVRIFDAQLHSRTPRSLADDIMAWGPEVVGFSVNYAPVLRNSEIMAEHIRTTQPSVAIVFGGNYSTFNWQTLADHPFVDYVVLHEAEESFPRLLTVIQNSGGKLPSGTVRCLADGSVEQQPFAGYIQDLDSLPFSDYDLFDDPSAYLKGIVSSRGCPYTCIYCSTKEMWQKWRYRSARSVADEMLALAAKYDIDEVLFGDDTFLVRKDRVRELCSILQAEGNPLLWGFSTRLETINRELIDTLAKSGCRSIFFGVESGSDAVLRKMERHYSQQELIEKIKMCADYGITCTASFMIGLPWETEADVRATFSAMEQVSTHRLILNIFTPLSGTPAMQSPEEYGIQYVEQPDPRRQVIGPGYVGYDSEFLTAGKIKDLWLEGQNIVLRKSRQKRQIDASISRNRYGLLGASSGPA